MHLPKIPLFSQIFTVYALHSIVFALNTNEFHINATVFHQILLYLPPNTNEFSQIMTVPKILLFLLPITTVFAPNTTVLATNTTTFFQNTNICLKYCCICDNRPLYFKIFVWQCESRAQRTNVKSHCGGWASSVKILHRPLLLAGAVKQTAYEDAVTVGFNLGHSVYFRYIS